MGGMFAGYGDDLDKMTPYARHFIEASVSGEFGNKDALAAENILRQLYAKLADEVYAKGYDIIIVPTLPTSHVPADYDFTVDEALVEDGREFPKSLGAQYTLPFNFMNWNPVVTVPAGINSQGMPAICSLIIVVESRTGCIEAADDFLDDQSFPGAAHYRMSGQKILVRYT